MTRLQMITVPNWVRRFMNSTLASEYGEVERRYQTALRQASGNAIVMK
ncbi:MAG: hypothetical protein ACR5LD_04960 [Symbiopectobacterium sp.]